MAYNQIQTSGSNTDFRPAIFNENSSLVCRKSDGDSNNISCLAKKQIEKGESDKHVKFDSVHQEIAYSSEFQICTDFQFIDMRSVHETIIPMDDLSEKARNFLGNYNYERFCSFKDEIKDGWDFGVGKALSGLSIAIFDLFMSMINRIDADPSIFMTSSGNLQFVYEDADDNTIDIEFYNDKIEYYIEKTDEESEIRNLTKRKISEFIQKLDCIS